jgi:hypothetical protein
VTGTPSPVPIRAARRTGGLPGLRNAQPPADPDAPHGDTEVTPTAPAPDAAATAPDPQTGRAVLETDASVSPNPRATDPASQERRSPDDQPGVEVEPPSRHPDTRGIEHVAAAHRDPTPHTPPARRRGPRTDRDMRVAIDVVALDGRKTSQLNFYTFEPLRRHVARLAFELQQDGLRTSQSELFNALLALGPADADAARQLLRAYRSRTEHLP